MMQSFDWQGALESCSEVLRDDPDHLGALETLAKAQWLGGQYKEVIVTTNHLLRLNPHEPGYRYTRGMAYLSLGQLRRSAEDLRRAYLQSGNPSFKSQVASALDAVELWLEEGTEIRKGEHRSAQIPDMYQSHIGGSILIH